MFTLENDPVKMAGFLKPRIIQKYGNIRKFCIEYLKRKDGIAESEEIRKLLNRFSKMLQGNGQIQIYDLPYVTELLGISCEEVLCSGLKEINRQVHILTIFGTLCSDRSCFL